jgi:hypothetical protein
MSVSQVAPSAVQTTRIYRRIHDCRALWTQAAPLDNLLLQVPYLAAVEAAPPEGMAFRYAVPMAGDQPLGVVYCQTIYFDGKQSIRYHRHPTEGRCFFQTLGKFLRGLVARQVGFHTLVCGNLMISGAHGYAFGADVADPDRLLEETLRDVTADLEREGIEPSVMLLKDFEPGSGPHRPTMERRRYHPFHILPSLSMDLDPAWRTEADYLAALSSKYRVRARKARQKMATGLSSRPLLPEEIIARSRSLYELYLQVVDDSGFNVLTLHPDYFAALQQHMGDALAVHGYFHDETLIGFTTALCNTNGEMEAHFLGYQAQWNPPHRLYLNMLLDLVALGINHGMRRIHFARTADEIKSSVGATSIDLTCYIRHRSPFSNKFIKPLLDYLTPSESPVLRHPFKK